MNNKGFLLFDSIITITLFSILSLSLVPAMFTLKTIQIKAYEDIETLRELYIYLENNELDKEEFNKNFYIRDKKICDKKLQRCIEY